MAGYKNTESRQKDITRHGLDGYGLKYAKTNKRILLHAIKMIKNVSKPYNIFFKINEVDTEYLST